jgi:hypothetical protein
MNARPNIAAFDKSDRYLPPMYCDGHFAEGSSGYRAVSKTHY